MTDKEQRARELLAAEENVEMAAKGMQTNQLTPLDVRIAARRAIIAALTDETWRGMETAEIARRAYEAGPPPGKESDMTWDEMTDEMREAAIWFTGNVLAVSGEGV